jgi:hypothetical protein
MQDAMGRMADTVLKKSNEAEKEFERQIIRDSNARDLKALNDEKQRKDKMRKRDVEIKQVLDQQLREKKEQKEREFNKNKEYVALVIARDEKDKADQKN